MAAIRERYQNKVEAQRKEDHDVQLPQNVKIIITEF